MAEKLKSMDKWSTSRDTRQGPLCSRWIRQQELWGNQEGTIVHRPWAGNGEFRGAKGGGKICFGTGKATSDLSSWEVKRQLRDGYQRPMAMPRCYEGARPEYTIYSNETLRKPTSPCPTPPRTLAPVLRSSDSLPWKHEIAGSNNKQLWGSTNKQLHNYVPDRAASSLSRVMMSPSGEGMAVNRDIRNTGLQRSHTSCSAASWTAHRPLTSTERESRRMETWTAHRLAATTRSGLGKFTI